MKTTEENNALIAEFMDGILSQVPNLINIPQTKREAKLLCEKGSSVLPNGTYALHRINELKYHTSLDWLAPAIRKAESVLYRMSSDWEEEDERHSDLTEILERISWAKTSLRVKQLYEALIPAIEWYNEQNTDNQ